MQHGNEPNCTKSGEHGGGRLGNDREQHGVIDCKNLPVGPDQRWRIGLTDPGRERDLLGECVRRQIPAIEMAILAIHEDGVRGRIDHRVVNAPFVNAAIGRSASARAW